MAILFTKDISTTRLNLAYTNNVVEFNSTSLVPILKAEISIGSTVKTLYPNPTGTIFYNFREWIESLINVDNFKDDLNPNLLVNGYLYDWTNKVYLNSIVSFKVIYTDTTFEIVSKDLHWLSGYTQLDEWKRKDLLNINISKPFVLSNFESGVNNKSYVKYWDGYPFDVSIYTGVLTALKITNLSNLLDYTFATQNKVNRLVFSDGNTSTSLTSALPLSLGFNELKITSNTYDTYLTVEKIDDSCGGVYVKWINRFGGWSYWLFNNDKRKRQTKDLGELENDFNNFEDTISPNIQLGKSSKDYIDVETDIINQQEVLLMEDLIDSPKIYLFTGVPFAKNNFSDWLEVGLKNSDFKLKNAKTDNNNLLFQFELPQRNTRVL